MNSSLCKLRNLSVKGNLSLISCTFLRHGHHLRGKPPGVAKTLEEKLAEANYKDPALHYRVDIGLAVPKTLGTKKLQERLKIVKENRSNPDLERLARHKKLFIDLDEHQKEWFSSIGHRQIKTVADHYGIYEHLFGDAYFYPLVPLRVEYEVPEGILPVYYGNIVKPADASKKPTVTFEGADDGSLWSLIMTSPDSNLTRNDKECLHWFVGNIPGSDINKGETVVDYLQPFPPKGTGYHRFVFILYKQERNMDFSFIKKDGACLDLPQRTFSTYDFYRKRQDDMTPTGLAFFQSDWDSSLKEFYHNSLGMKEPIFEYDFPPHFIKKQKWYPKRQPFNLYMDKYRDPKQINKEFLMRKLKDVHPFKDPPPPLPYPNAQYFEGYIPSWLKLEIRKSRLKWGRINDIE